MTEIRLVAETADAGAGTGAEGDAALDGRADDLGEDGRALAEGVGRRVVVRVEGAGADVAIDHAEGGQTEGGEAAALRPRRGT